ncbi:pyridoxal phosphate-dependent aminotransferase [Butyrivibrio sp. XB500-5]|uniref:pyridoxal phosphate-dependent aminotransferase n=1 Tax=Butyrivibrio sp. XB500-5 TaxID=2364880 RepID=UPI000EAABCE5|nr:pyridoxal phosphate-dependent aminotransferase [Butyrivibrio sp. XB500-5]RKM60267.1 pyridoxal phosphate-dependent aminotransferase [Butyrivibrio sp. XB500-5]
MINESFKSMLGAKSVIRELSEYATARGKEIGYENVFDFSLGNPSVEVPKEFTEEMIRLLQEENTMTLHGYTPSLGNPLYKAEIAKSLNERFGMNYGPEHIFPTTGAAGAIAHAVRAITKPGDEVIAFAPFFPEYGPYITGAGCKLSIVPADTTSFQINFEKFEEMLNPGVMAVLVNTPNNPSGVAYSTQTLTKLAEILTAKSKEYGHVIYLMSDEPYREIVFKGADAPYVSKFYDNTLSCYSFSKSLSLPGERIGYVAVNPACEGAEFIVPMCGQISRGTGHNCPPSIIQMAVAKVCGMTADLSVYETNMNIIYNTLVELGFEVVKPGGTFYIMPKALEENSIEFCKKAKDYDLIFVPTDGFGAPGYFRMAYCIDTEKVERAMERLRKFVAEVYGK